MSNILHTQQYVYLPTGRFDERHRFETIHVETTEATVCPEIDLDSRDVGEGIFRLQLQTESGEVLDTSAEVEL